MSVRKVHRELITWLREQGATDVYVDSAKRRHPRIWFRHGGRTLSASVSGSPGDHRYFRNMTSQLRRMMDRAPEPATPGAPVRECHP